MKSCELVINLTDGVRWLSFLPLRARSFVLHGFLAADRKQPSAVHPERLEGILCKMTSRKKRLVTLSQTHRDRCVVVTSKDKPESSYDGDAILTNRDDIFISVQVADCLPIFLINETSQVVGLVHAGWRGTILGIAQESLRKAKINLGCQAEDFTAVLGPCIRGCCYEISEDVAILFDRECIKPRDGDRWSLDLICANLKQLTDCGVKQDRIFVTSECTCCNADLFFSHRREGISAGRMVGFMALR